MITLLGAIGWGLLASGAITHVWHHERLRELLGMHIDHERVPALVLTAVEVALAAALPVLVITDGAVLVPAALAAGLLALGFVVWIAQLLASGSELPCACSFSQAPTSRWSLVRALCVVLVLCLAFSGGQTASTGELVATLGVGWAIGAAIFVLPEALAWPTASRALLARVEAHGAP